MHRLQTLLPIEEQLHGSHRLPLENLLENNPANNVEQNQLVDHLNGGNSFQFHYKSQSVPSSLYQMSFSFEVFEPLITCPVSQVDSIALAVRLEYHLLRASWFQVRLHSELPEKYTSLAHRR